MSTSAANIRVVSIIPWAAMTTAPSPWLDPMNSATTTPTRASTTATRSPARMAGSPMGSFSRSSVCSRVAPSMRNSCSRWASAWRRPVSVFSISGKKQISAVISTVGSKPKPNHSTNKGASASLGTTWLTTT